jgi:hypothetical protein
VQNHSICERNPLEIDIVPSSISRTRGAIIVAYSRDRHEVLTGSTNAVIFDDGSMFNEALRQLRPYPDDSVSSRRLHAARLPRWVLRELKLVMQVHARLGSGPAARKKLGISSSAILGRLRLAHAVGAAALRHVEASRFTPGEVIADRQAYIDTREGFPPQDTAGRRRAQRHAARIKAC